MVAIVAVAVVVAVAACALDFVFDFLRVFPTPHSFSQLHQTLKTGDFFGEECALTIERVVSARAVRSVDYSDLLRLKRDAIKQLKEDLDAITFQVRQAALCSCKYSRKRRRRRCSKSAFEPDSRFSVPLLLCIVSPLSSGPINSPRTSRHCPGPGKNLSTGRNDARPWESNL